MEENISLVEKFIQNNLPMQPYTYAIHSKSAKMDPNHMNVHVHLMFSDRMLEEDRNISIEEFFKRHSRKKDGTIIGGAKKIDHRRLDEIKKEKEETNYFQNTKIFTGSA